MEAFQVADTLRREINRQAKDNPELAVGRDQTPDMIRVVGKLDLYELAKKIAEQ